MARDPRADRARKRRRRQMQDRRLRMAFSAAIRSGYLGYLESSRLILSSASPLTEEEIAHRLPKLGASTAPQQSAGNTPSE